ncbi:MAG: family 16 glycoside hydrolase [Planctomycetota bacterium]
MPRFAIAAVLLVFASVCFSDGPEKRPDGETCELRLQNGSVIKGMLRAPREVTLKVKGGKKTVSFDDTWSLSIGVVKREEADRVVTSEGVVEGWTTDMPDFEIDTGYGVLEIPAADLKGARFRRPGRDLTCDFSDGKLGGWAPTGASVWEVAGGVLKVKPTPMGGDMILLAPTFDGEFTIEADVTCGSWAAIMFHSEDASNAAALWLTPGIAGVYANPDWKNTAVANWQVPTVAGKAVHAKLEVNGSQVKVWIDGTFVGEANVPADAGRIGFGCWTSEATFDNLKVTR